MGKWSGSPPAFFTGVLVVVKDGGGGVEGHGDELAVRGGVVAGHGAEELGGVHRGTGGFHDFIHGADGALGGHHAGGAHFKNLDQVGVLFGAEGGDGGGHGFVIVALVDALDFVFVLRRVEFLDHLVGDFTEFATHAVPEGNGGLGLDRRGQQHQTHGQQGHQTEGTHMLSCVGGRKTSGCILSGASPRNVRRGAPARWVSLPGMGSLKREEKPSPESLSSLLQCVILRAPCGGGGKIGNDGRVAALRQRGVWLRSCR